MELGSKHWDTNTSQLTKAPSSTNTKLVYHPQTEGITVVTVTDRCPPYDRAFGQVYVSQAHSVHLHGNDMYVPPPGETVPFFNFSVVNNSF